MIFPIGIPLLGEALERGRTVVIKAAVHGAMLLPLIRITTWEVGINGVPGVAVEETRGIQQAVMSSGTTTQEAINGEPAVITGHGMGLEMIRTTRVLGIQAIMQILAVVLLGVTAPQTTNSKRTVIAATTMTEIRDSQVLQQEKRSQLLP